MPSLLMFNAGEGGVREVRPRRPGAKQRTGVHGRCTGSTAGFVPCLLFCDVRKSIDVPARISQYDIWKARGLAVQALQNDRSGQWTRADIERCREYAVPLAQRNR